MSVNLEDMTFAQFFVQLLLLTAIIVLSLFLIGTIFEQNSFDVLSIGSILFFLLLCPFLFWWGKRAAHSTHPNAFSRMALASIGIKMFLAILIVAIYVKMNAPQSKLFLLNFLTIYFGYTIFETYFMMKIGKELPTSTQSKKDGIQ